MGAANNGDFSEHLEELQRSCFGTDKDCDRLGHQLHLVHDAVRTVLFKYVRLQIKEPCAKFSTKLLYVAKTLLGEIYKLRRLFLTLPVASATLERTFSPLRRLKNYLRSTMKQDRLNNCLLMHCHKSIMDALDTVKIAKRFACGQQSTQRTFWEI